MENSLNKKNNHVEESIMEMYMKSLRMSVENGIYENYLTLNNRFKNKFLER
jgi:hypothetical protein